jgi:hypothetical protein
MNLILIILPAESVILERRSPFHEGQQATSLEKRDISLFQNSSEWYIEKQLKEIIASARVTKRCEFW